jgi:hypothetical protein
MFTGGVTARKKVFAPMGGTSAPVSVATNHLTVALMPQLSNAGAIVQKTLIAIVATKAHQPHTPSKVPAGFIFVSHGAGGSHNALWRCGSIFRMPDGEFRRCTVMVRKDCALKHDRRNEHPFLIAEDGDPGFPNRLR